MKKLLIFGMIMCLLAGLVSAQSISVENGKIIGENTYKPTFWESLSSFQFSFVGNPGEARLSGSNLCTVKQSSGELVHTGGQSTSAGAICDAKDFITFIASGDSSDGTIKKGQFIFDQLWYKETSTDLVKWTNYNWVNEKSFRYYYVCLKCEQLDTTSTEQGCLSKDGKSCVTKQDINCGTDYIYQSVCLTHTSVSGSSDGVPSTVATTTEPSIKFSEIKITNNGNLDLGQIFEIKGSAYVTGQVTGAVIETGYTDDYFSPLSISTSSNQKGACGDDKTTGVKFTTKDNWVTFSLKLKAEKLGKQRLRLISSPGCGSGKILDYMDIYLEVKETLQTPDTTILSNNCENSPSSISCVPTQCTDSECDLTTCTTDCNGDSTILIDSNKPKPNWFSTENLIIATVGMAILITASYIGLRRKRK